MKSESKQMHLDNLYHAIREFVRRKGLEECSINEDVLGLPERAVLNLMDLQFRRCAGRG